MPGLVDDTHSAAAYFFEHLILADGERHRSRCLAPAAVALGRVAGIGIDRSEVCRRQRFERLVQLELPPQRLGQARERPLILRKEWPLSKFLAEQYLAVEQIEQRLVVDIDGEEVLDENSLAGLPTRQLLGANVIESRMQRLGQLKHDREPPAPGE